MNHLEQAKRQVDKAQSVTLEFAPLQAQVGILHALIALVERLDAPAPKSRVAAYDWSAIMDEVDARISTRVRACPHCSGEECSH